MRLRRAFFALLAPLCFSAPSFAQTALDLAEGTWEVVPGHSPKDSEIESFLKCGVNPLTVRIDQEAKRYYFRFDLNDPETGADILRSEDSFFSIQYDDEERLMNNGEPHIWFMYFENDDQFVWIRQDWLKHGGTSAPRRRCKPEIG